MNRRGGRYSGGGGSERSAEETALLERLRKVEALCMRPGTAGEGAAARQALERILARLRELQREEVLIEYRFSLHDPWLRWFFLELARRHGIQPYRHPRQRRTTVLIRTRPPTARFLENELARWRRALVARLDAVTRQIIFEAIREEPCDLGGFWRDG